MVFSSAGWNPLLRTAPAPVALSAAICFTRSAALLSGAGLQRKGKLCAGNTYRSSAFCYRSSGSDGFSRLFVLAYWYDQKTKCHAPWAKPDPLDRLANPAKPAATEEHSLMRFVRHWDGSKIRDSPISKKILQATPRFC